MARANKIIPRLVAAPQANEDAVKTKMQKIKNRFRPKRMESQLLAGSTTAFATK